MPSEPQSKPRQFRRASADDYAEPLAGMIRRGEIEPPDELVIDDREPRGSCIVHGDYWTDDCTRCDWSSRAS